MNVEILEKKFEIPEGVDVTSNNLIITVKGPKGEVKRNLANPKIKIIKEANKVIVSADDATKREKKEVYTYVAHIKNMIKGVTQGHTYELKICSGHFPMNVSISGQDFTIKNFIGEKNPRKLKLKPGVSVKINGDQIVVEHTNKELAGQTAASIEQLTRRPGFDSRIFQDGIYIVNKDGKQL